MRRRLPTGPGGRAPLSPSPSWSRARRRRLRRDTPSGGPAGSGGQAPGVSGSPTAGGPGTGTAGPGGPAPSGSAGGPGDGSTELITAAYAAGRIDRPTALLYRLQASVGDDRLPAEFQAPSFEDDGAGSIVLAEWDTFTAEQQAAFMPYLVRPTDPGSVFAPASVAAGSRRVRLASTRLARRGRAPTASCARRPPTSRW